MNWEINYDFYRLSIVLKYLVMKNSESKESYKWLFILEKFMYTKSASNLKTQSDGHRGQGKVEYYQPFRKRDRSISTMNHQKLLLSVQSAVHLLAARLSQQIL